MIEVYCYRIFLAASHDLGWDLPLEFVGNLSTRLRCLRNFLQSRREDDLALDVLELEVQIHQEEMMIYELDHVEDFSQKRCFIPNITNARIVCTEFISHIQLDDQAGIVAKYSEGFAYLLLAKAFAEKPNRALVQKELEDCAGCTEAIFSSFSCAIGIGEVQLLKLGAGIGPTESTTDWMSITAVFNRHGYLTGVLELGNRKAAQDPNDHDMKIHLTRPEVYKELLPIVKLMGNELLYRLYQLQSMTSWVEGLTFVHICEQVFHPMDGFLSDELCTTASQLLSRLYRLNNNFPEASAYALLHLKYMLGRNDPHMLDRASMNYFQSIGDLVPTVSEEDRIIELISLSVSFERIVCRLCQSVLTGLHSRKAMIMCSDLPIESLLQLANLVRHIIHEDFIHSASPQLLSTLHRTLQLSMDLLSLLPSPLRILFDCSVSVAIGKAAELCANPMLSLLCYSLGEERTLRSNSFDLYTLRSHIGRRLTSWIYYDRPNFLHFQELAWAYLTSAEEFFWKEDNHQLSYRNGLETSLVLSRSYLREVQFSMEDVDWGEDEHEDLFTLAQVGNKNRLVDLIKKGLASISKAFTSK